MTREANRNMNNKSDSGNKLTQSPVNTPTKGGENSSTNTTMADIKSLLEANLQQMNSKYELLTERIDTLTIVISSQPVSQVLEPTHVCCGLIARALFMF